MSVLRVYVRRSPRKVVMGVDTNQTQWMDVKSKCVCVCMCACHACSYTCSIILMNFLTTSKVHN